MKTLIIFMHPRPRASKYGMHVIESLQRCYDVDVHCITDVITPECTVMTQQSILAEQQLLLKYDRYFFISPMYWYSITSLGQAWLEQVFQPGFGYIPQGCQSKLEGKQAVLIITSATRLCDFCEVEYGTEKELFSSFAALCKKCLIDYKGLFVFARDTDFDKFFDEIVQKIQK